jgi:hypothetical protein
LNDYPVVQFLVRHGSAVAIVAALCPLVGAVIAFAAGAHWAFLPAGIVAGGFAWLLIKSYAEVVAIIADMLLPK